jgi:hypothetical protein
MAFNVHSFCNNKLKIKIKFHCFIYNFEYRQVPLPYPEVSEPHIVRTTKTGRLRWRGHAIRILDYNPIKENSPSKTRWK